ncbi:MAG: hypothetical protein FJY85_19815 [Deltaproteobacteria bacterium]|nr:hypothetical protein [Deltaproteobacteria bacterium]
MNAKTQQPPEQPTIETAPLGYTFTDQELAAQCRVVVGGIAWPGKRPGYGVTGTWLPSLKDERIHYPFVYLPLLTLGLPIRGSYRAYRWESWPDMVTTGS